jgi:2-hydroxychromene-2-carboxylate isomerase
MREPTIDLWFTMGSTYTYLTMARLDGVAARHGVRFQLRPFRTVGALTGATQPPFAEGSAKFRYMWRDIERRAAAHALPVRFPVAYPAPNPVRANRIALIGMREGWGPAYVREAYRLWFEEGIGNGGAENLRAALTTCGQAGQIDRILAEAESEAVAVALDAATEEARALGVFGSPTFVVGTEPFWGDDHLEDAALWALHGKLEGPRPGG